MATGCTPNQVDSLRPEVNNAQGMLVFPEQYSSGMEEISQIDGSSGLVDNNTNYGDLDIAGGTVVVSDKFEALPYNVMCATDYSSYLDSQVYQPIKDILDTLENDASQHLYFRVYHSGYESVPDNTTQIKRGSTYDNRSIGVGTYLRGTVFPELAVDWLGTRPTNAKAIGNARTSLLSKIKSCNVALQSKWEEVSASSTSNLDAAILKLWGNEELNAETLNEFLSIARVKVIGVLPNLKLSVATGSNSSTAVTLNEVDAVSGPRYYTGMKKLSVDRMFGNYNQYTKREATKVSVSVEDDYGAVFAYIDGYSKTIVALCAFDGYDLSTLLGSHKVEVLSKIENTLDYTRWPEIAEFVPDATILQSGVRGID